MSLRLLHEIGMYILGMINFKYLLKNSYPNFGYFAPIIYAKVRNERKWHLLKYSSNWAFKSFKQVEPFFSSLAAREIHWFHWFVIIKPEKYSQNWEELRTLLWASVLPILYQIWEPFLTNYIIAKSNEIG